MSTQIQTISPYEQHNTIAGIENKRGATSAAAALLTEKDMPEEFPFYLWSEQASRYQEYWAWFTGVRLATDTGVSKDGRSVSKFPLQINTIRNFARKHTTLLFGEIPDTPHQVVRSKVKPKNSFMEDDSEDNPNKRVARFYENILNEVRTQSHGNAIMFENGLLSQFLGGCYFRYQYIPPEVRPDLRVPILVKKIIPDFVLPVWSTEDEFELNEAWIIYRISRVAAQREYGVEISNMYGNYVEHWTKKKYSIHIDGKPLVANYKTPYGEHTIDYGEQENPFGFVPMVYIPRIREGNFYGSSLVPDIAALTLEFNGRFADVGTLVHKLAKRTWFGRNITATPRPRQLDNGVWYVDLGMQNPSVNNPPEVWAQDPAEVSNTLVDFNDSLHEQLLREGSLTDVAFGQVDGTQRSGETLKSLMWPATAIVRPQRLNWTAGLTHGDKMILEMLSIKGFKIEGRTIPRYLAKNFEFSQDWLSILPKDREQLVNEVVQLSGVKRSSIEQSLAKLGDVEDIQEEAKRIKEEMEMEAELTKPPEPSNSTSDGGSE